MRQIDMQLIRRQIQSHRLHVVERRSDEPMHHGPCLPVPAEQRAVPGEQIRHAAA
jgi:hypothetical protein